jgi:hypothetical protein
VYTVFVKNITLSADENLIEAARKRAREERTTLNEQFRRWLADYAGREHRVAVAMEAIRELQKQIHLEGPFTREEMNER